MHLNRTIDGRLFYLEKCACSGGIVYCAAAQTRLRELASAQYTIPPERVFHLLIVARKR